MRLGENVLITCQRTERSSSLAHSSPSGQPGPRQVAAEVVGGRHALVHKFSPSGRELLCLIKFFGIISLLERSRGYPRRYSHSTVDAAVRLPYRNTETRKRPKTKVRLGTRFTPAALKGNNQTDRPFPRFARAGPEIEMSRTGTSPAFAVRGWDRRGVNEVRANRTTNHLASTDQARSAQGARDPGRGLQAEPDPEVGAAQGERWAGSHGDQHRAQA